MLFGSESKQVLDLVSDHLEKKLIRNLLTALQDIETEGGKRKGGKGQQPGKAGQGQSQTRQVKPRVGELETKGIISCMAVVLVSLHRWNEAHRGPGGGGVLSLCVCVDTHFMHSRSRMTMAIRPSHPTMSGRGMSSVHRPSRHSGHQTQTTVRCSAIRTEGELRLTKTCV